MNKILIGMALGAFAGAYAYKKVVDDRSAEKLLSAAREKMSD